MAVSGRGSRRPGGQMSDRGELQSIVVASSTWSESSRTLRRDFKGISVALNGEARFTLGRSYRTHTPDSSVAYMCLPLHRSTNNTHTPRRAVCMFPTTPEQIHADSRSYFMSRLRSHLTVYDSFICTQLITYFMCIGLRFACIIR